VNAARESAIAEAGETAPPVPASPSSDPLEDELDAALALTFPASDPPAVTPPAAAAFVK
jgi:hypothetical protein